MLKVPVKVMHHMATSGQDLYYETNQLNYPAASAADESIR